MTGPSDAPVIGIDIGGTKIAVGLVDRDGRILERARGATPADQGPDRVLDAAAALAKGLAGEDRAVAVGVASPGTIDHATGIVTSATDLLLGWAGTAVGEELARRLERPVTVDNDVNAAGIGEAALGAGRRRRCVLLVAAGTGIGGALIMDGRLVRGAHGIAGELGHVLVPSAGTSPRCSCGRTNHLEAAASGPAMVRAAAERGVYAIDAGELARLAVAGHARARKVIVDAASVLGRALGGLVNAVDPDIVLVAGGVAGMGEELWKPLRAAFEAEVLPPAVGLPLRRATLGDDAGTVGAALLARRHTGKGI